MFAVVLLDLQVNIRILKIDMPQENIQKLLHL